MSKTEKTYYTLVDSAIDPLLVTSDGAALTGLYMADYRGEPVALPAGAVRADALPVLVRAREELQAYFRGELAAFTVPVVLSGTPFQRRVLEELQRIPYGQTISYGELARRIGRPAAVRAVGAANGRNPISIIVPCHRVIGASGALTGFGGGLPRKQALLQLERAGAGQGQIQDQSQAARPAAQLTLGVSPV